LNEVKLRKRSEQTTLLT